MNKWGNIYAYGLDPEMKAYVEKNFAAPYGYHLYEAEVFSDLLAYSAIGLFIHPFSMDEDDFEILMKFYETAYADTESLTIVFMDAVEIPPSLADTSIYIYKDCAEWIARVRKSLSYCEGMRERERNEMLEMMGECGEEE